MGLEHVHQLPPELAPALLLPLQLPGGFPLSVQLGLALILTELGPPEPLRRRRLACFGRPLRLLLPVRQIVGIWRRHEVVAVLEHGEHLSAAANSAP